jgi:zinc/manganese transport system substrate-binding protein
LFLRFARKRGLVQTPDAMGAASHERALEVVTTFSILGDFARNVGGNQVDVKSLVGPNGDVHVYTPTPADAEAIRNARLVIVNGLGLEGWLPRLIESSGGNAIRRNPWHRAAQDYRR